MKKTVTSKPAMFDCLENADRATRQKLINDLFLYGQCEYEIDHKGKTVYIDISKHINDIDNSSSKE